MKARWELVSSTRSVVLAPSARDADALEEVGGRPEVPGPGALLTAMSDAGVTEDGSDERGRGGLAGGARDADARAPPALEQQVAEAREARTASTELRDPRRDLGRPDVEVRDLGLTGVGIEVDAGLDVDPELTQLPRLGGLGLRAREPHRVALAGEQSRERHCVGVEPLDQDIHTWIIAGRRRSPARRRASRRVARGAVELQQAVERLTGEVTTRCGSKPRRRAEAAPLPVLRSLDEAMPRAFLQGVAARAVEVFLGEDRSRVVRALEEVPTRVMAPVEPHRVHAFEALHPAMRAPPVRPERRMEMVAEEAPGEELPAEPDDDVIEEIQEQIAVGRVEEEAAARVPGRP